MARDGFVARALVGLGGCREGEGEERDQEESEKIHFGCRDLGYGWGCGGLGWSDGSAVLAVEEVW